MMKTSYRYKRARRDFEALEAIAELDDQMTIEDEMDNFMRSPTREFAAGLYESKIELWFREHGVTDKTKRIAERHGLN